MQDIISFTFVNREFFEDLSNYQISSEFDNILKKKLPKNWKVEKSGIWLMAYFDGNNIPPQGFKIHISSTPYNAKTILKIIIHECIKQNVPFKVIGDLNLLSFINSKNYYRGSAGKFVAIYPYDLNIFKKMIENIYLKTKKLNGPYILSDKRYKDSKVVFYRYGGFKPRNILNIDNKKTAVILSPNGDIEIDERLPFFKLPNWVADPFENSKPNEYEGSIILNNIYKVENVLNFSNSGGVYKGVNLDTNELIVIKEARPFTNIWSKKEIFWDSCKILEREFKILKKLEKSIFIPKPIDIFREWEHLFLIEEYVEGITLSNFRAREDFNLIPYIDVKEKVNNFCLKFKSIAIKLIEAVIAIHNHNIILGDLSPYNILINPDNLNIKIIDFESAYDIDEFENIEYFSSAWGTPGFRSSERNLKSKITFEDDYFSLGMVLYSLVLPIQTFFDFNHEAKELFIDEIIKNSGLPIIIKKVIFSLLNGEAEYSINILNNMNTKGINKNSIKILQKDQKKRNNLKSIVEKIGDYIIDTYDINRKDRLWPGDYTLFLTNPLSVAYGACGILLFLREISKDIPNDIFDWLFNKPLDNNSYAPGLYLGLSGIAFTFLELGYMEKAEKILDLAYTSQMLFDEPNIFYGAAGWGLVSLYFHYKTKNKKYLYKACEAGNYILKCSMINEKKCFWRNSRDKKIYFGFGYGASGISLFLLHLYITTKENTFLNYALAALEFDIANSISINDGLSWSRFEGDDLLSPYWLQGSAGVGSVLIRFYHTLGDIRFKELAQKAAKTAFSKFSVQPSQFEGLSGIGEFMLDMFHFSNDEEYKLKAFEIAESILLYKIEKPKGIAFPGRFLLRISNDYGTGSAGIGLFLNRLINQTKRHFHDLF